MNQMIRAFVILANGDRIDSDANVVSDAVINSTKWQELFPLTEKGIQNFHKLTTVSLYINRKEQIFQTKFLASAGVDAVETTDPPTVSDEEVLDGLYVDNKEVLEQIMQS